MSEYGRIVPVILSGGAGTRLWPLSTAAKPKQFLALTGDLTMLQETALRVADAASFAPPLVVGSADHAGLIEEQLAGVGVAAEALILEPSARSTAPAIALAALAVEAESLLLVMPSDHAIADSAAFRAAVEAGRPFAEQGWLVTFGIRPTAPETGFGYIRRGEELGPGVNRVERFVEKPDSATARAWLDEGSYDWNGGIFLLGAGRYLEALRTHAPAIAHAAEAAMGSSARSGAAIRPDAAAFAAAPAVPIDYAVMEKDPRVAVVPVDMGWSDIGSWDSLHAFAAGADGNAADGPATLIDSRGCLVRSTGLPVVTIGAEDLIVIATEEAVLVVPRGLSQRVRETLQKRGR